MAASKDVAKLSLIESTTIQPTTIQPTTVQPTTVQWSSASAVHHHRPANSAHLATSV
jgi:hypothetical protein